MTRARAFFRRPFFLVRVSLVKLGLVRLHRQANVTPFLQRVSCNVRRSVATHVAGRQRKGSYGPCPNLLSSLSVSKFNRSHCDEGIALSRA